MIYKYYRCIGLETVCFKGKVPERIRGYGGEIPTTCIIKVPSEYLQDYKDAFGPINIFMPGILMNQVTMISRLLNAHPHPSLTKQES